MSRVLLFALGALLLCAAALAALWAAGQALAALGALLTGAAGVLGRLLIFLVLGAFAGGLSYFVASAWRPGQPVAGQSITGQPVAGQVDNGQAATPVSPATQPASRGPRWLRGKRTGAAPSRVAPTETSLAESPVTETADSTVVIAAAPQVIPGPQNADGQVADRQDTSLTDTDSTDAASTDASATANPRSSS